MLLSMTGHGAGSAVGDRLRASAEIRSVNNRFLKIAVRCSDGFGLLDTRIEDHLRGRLKRGTVTVNVRIVRKWSEADIQVNEPLLAGYLQLVRRVGGLGEAAPVDISTLLELPGVLADPSREEADLDAIWPTVLESLDQAVESLEGMRQREGRAMADDLLANLASIDSELEAIVRRSPLVVESYQARLTERLQKLLAQHDVQVNAADLIREVGIFADRCDIAEETVRLRSHLTQFRAVIGEAESNGRKLDFITQEMFRETNTIGSKANDSEIAHHVVGVKTTIERIREMVQNIE